MVVAVQSHEVRLLGGKHVVEVKSAFTQCTVTNKPRASRTITHSEIPNTECYQ